MEEAMLRYELEEAKSEIRRHHQDFERLRKLADDIEDIYWTDPDIAEEIAKLIRNIVG